MEVFIQALAESHALLEINRRDENSSALDCTKAYSYGWEYKEKCYSFLQGVPVWATLWNSAMFLCLVWMLPIAFAYFNKMVSLISIYRGNKAREVFPLMDLEFWASFSLFIANIGMSISYIDGWGFFGRYSVSFYLGIYPVAYAAFPLGIILLQLKYFNKFIWDMLGRSSIRIAKGYTWFVLLAVILIALFAGLGFPIYGQILRSAYLKDHNTPLGSKGNHLVAAMYLSIVALNVLVMIPGIYMFLKKYDETVRTNNILDRCVKMVNWTIVTTMICICMVTALYVFTKAGSDVIAVNMFEFTPIQLAYLPVLSTLLMLTFNRIVEIGLSLSTLYVSDTIYTIWPGEAILQVFTGRKRNVRVYTTPSNGSSATLESLPPSVNEESGKPAPPLARRTDFSRRPGEESSHVEIQMKSPRKSRKSKIPDEESSI